MTNGCIARAVPLAVVEAPGAGDDPAIRIRSTLKCDASADARWHSFSGSFYEVRGDGTLRTIYAPGLMSRGEGPPLDTRIATVTIYPCEILGFGTHTWLARFSIKTKHDNNGDPNPFVAKVARQQTLTCG